MDLDNMPLEVLLALRDRLFEDPDAAPVALLAPGDIPRFDLEPIPMEPAPDGVESLTLRFGTTP